MKNGPLVVVLISIFSIIIGCKKTDTVTVPQLSTSQIANITFSSATSGGNITSDGNGAVTARGVCWSISSGPVISDSKTSDGNGTGQFASNITGLTPGTLYYLRAYATNSAGTGYGEEVTFASTALQVPSLSTSSVTLITTTTAISGGIITDDGGSGITARGVCWGTVSSPTISGSHTTDGTGKGTFSSNLTGLSASTLYYVRAYATNGTGTAYGNEFPFTTKPPQAANEVVIQGMAFSPLTLTVSVNTTVKWTNFDVTSHTVTSDSGVFSSGTIIPGGTFSFQFTSTGSFPYHCSIHPDMTATIIVQ